MNNPYQPHTFIILENSDGRKARLPVRYFNRHGIQLEASPTYLQHNSEVTVIFHYFLDNHLHFLRTLAIVERSQSRGVSLSFRLGSDAIEVAKRLSRAASVEDGLQQFHSAQISSTHMLKYC